MTVKQLKPQIPTEVEMKLEAAKQCELSIKRLAEYEQVFSGKEQNRASVHIPFHIQERFWGWIEAQIILERTRIQNYGK